MVSLHRVSRADDRSFVATMQGRIALVAYTATSHGSAITLHRR